MLGAMAVPQHEQSLVHFTSGRPKQQAASKIKFACLLVLADTPKNPGRQQVNKGVTAAFRSFLNFGRMTALTTHSKEGKALGPALKVRVHGIQGTARRCT
jgi:transposase